MSIKEHEDYEAELSRLEETKDYLERTIAAVVDKRKKFKGEIKEAYVLLDHVDSSLSYANIMLNSTLLDELEKNFSLLLNSRKKPYFARMDMQQADHPHTESLYIGKVSLFDESMEMPLVVDWRAPIAGVYYDGRLGRTSYLSNGKEFEIDLHKKRQYTIEKGELQDFVDVDISTTDTFLQATLENHAGDKLKDIVATIQGEQNNIIRADIAKPLIVQGVAGSGKTTIALHRIAYLIYTYSDTFTPEDFMIIAPNGLFLDYISGVLPELGADKVKQTTFIDLMFEWIGKRYRLTDSNHKLNELIRTDREGQSPSMKALTRKASAFKNSMQMKVLLDDYVARLESSLLPDEDYCIEDIVILEKDYLSSMYHGSYAYLPLYKRIDSMKQYLANHTRNATKELLKEIDDDYERQMDRIRNNENPSEERRLKLVTLIGLRDTRLETIRKSAKTAANRYISKIFKNDLLGFYKTLITDVELISGYLKDEDPEVVALIADEAMSRLAEKCVEIEDLAPLVYLKKRLFGLDAVDIKYVVIDEAQDFSDFQFHVLREVLDTDRFTILGDLSQGIHMYRSIRDWAYLRENIFSEEVNYLTLEQSYRTTIEIMDRANDVLKLSPLKNMIMAKPVVRHGKEPSIKSYTKQKELITALASEIESLVTDGFTTIAIVTKSSEEAKFLYKELSRASRHNLLLIGEKALHFDHDIVVLPSHLAKGLEFDAVVVTAIHDRFEFEELDAKLLYVAMTRALHRLSVICMENTIPYFDQG